MPDTILHKRNLTPGVAPTTESLSVGELAINVADKKLYTRSGSAIVILNDNTGSFTGSFTGELIGTASFTTSASYAPTILPIGIISSSTQFTSLTAPFTGSFTGSFKGLLTQSNIDAQEVVVRDYLELYPTSLTITPDANSAYFYVSGSGNDLWYTHKTDSTVNFDWIEGVLETGLIFGGINGFNGSEVHIRSGSGIIVNHSATTGSAPSPTVTYVQWPVITGSIDVTQGFVTYLAINANGILESSSTKFTSLDYHDKIPLGAVGHFNQQAIAAKGEQVNTQYSQTAQLTDFARNFGPIKVGGYGITPQSSSLKFSRAAGDAFIYGGFYSQNPETPSNFQSTAVSTGSLAYVYRTGSAQGYAIDANNNNFYTDIRPQFWDTGATTGISTGSVASNEWTIQRVFIEPVTGIHYIYYGQTKYTSLANALSNLTTDTFAEGPATTLFTVFIGYIIAKGNTTNLLDTTENSVVNAGLFRNTSAGSVGGGSAAQLLNDLSDVTVTSPSNGQALIYNSGVWINGTPTNATSASYALTSSFAVSASAATSITFTPVTASFAITASAADSITFTPTTASFSITSSFATTASAATSITFTPVTASYAVSSSYALSSSFAVTASYAPPILTTKAGSVANTSFTGNPKKATVTFTTAFPNTSYAVTVTGEDARSWTIESKLAGSFVINANSNTNLTGTTYWIATAYGET